MIIATIIQRLLLCDKLPLVSLPVFSHLEKVGISCSLPLAMGLKGLFCTGHILNS